MILSSLPKLYVEKYGVEKIVEVTGRPAGTVNGWVAEKMTPTVKDIQALLNFDPAPVHAEQPLYVTPAKPTRLALLMPTIRNPHWATVTALLTMWDNTKMIPLMETHADIRRNRNLLIQRFLATGCEWGWWWDDDMVPPCGDTDFFRSLGTQHNYPVTWAGMNSLHRLLFHKKTLVGACYFGRRDGGQAQFGYATGNTQASQDINRDAHRGPRDELREEPFVGFGCFLMHRTVVTDMIAKGTAQKLPPERAALLRYEHSFFEPVDLGDTEDVAFCKRAALAGHKTFVDMSIMPGHIGPQVFNYSNT